jgi:hypothetical protein
MVRLHVSSDQQNALPVIQSAIEAKKKRIEIGLKRTEQEISRFEAKYQMPSEKFLSRHLTAEDLEGGDDDYISWMGELRLRQAVLEELHILQDIEYAVQ